MLWIVKNFAINQKPANIAFPDHFYQQNKWLIHLACVYHDRYAINMLTMNMKIELIKFSALIGEMP